MYRYDTVLPGVEGLVRLHFCRKPTPKSIYTPPMDFAAQLASLNESASAAARRRGRSHNSYDNRRNQRQRRHSPPKDPRVFLTEKGFRTDPPPPESVPGPKDGTQHKLHICLLAITIDELPYEEIWKAWAAAGSEVAHVSLVCHAKFPDRVQSPWLKQRLILEPPRIGRGNQWEDPVPRTHKPAWGSVQILRAMLDVLHDGLLIGTKTNEEDESNDKSEEKTEQKAEKDGPDRETVKNLPEEPEKDPRFNPNRYYCGEDATIIPPVDKFIYISETCIPIVTLAECSESLGHADLSWVNARNQQTPGTPRNKYELDQFALIKLVPSCFRWKADQWMALSRRHAIAVRQMDNHMPETARMWKRGFSNINASDEMYFPTILAILGILKPQISKDQSVEESGADRTKAGETVQQKEGKAGGVLLRPVTYTDWSEGMKNPKSHVSTDLDSVVQLAKGQGSLLARKFTGPIDLAAWNEAVNEGSGEHAAD